MQQTDFCSSVKSKVVFGLVVEKSRYLNRTTTLTHNSRQPMDSHLRCRHKQRRCRCPSKPIPMPHMVDMPRTAHSGPPRFRTPASHILDTDDFPDADRVCHAGLLSSVSDLDMMSSRVAHDLTFNECLLRSLAVDCLRCTSLPLSALD